jgi:amidase
MANSQWAFETAIGLSNALARKEVSSVELTEHAIARIERHDTKINAVCVRDFERARDAARSADATRARGESKALLGIPLTIKESFNLAGTPTTWGIPAQRDFHPSEDALAVTRLKEAGGVILGKTNVPLALGDWQSYNDIYGTTNNPYDLTRTPGGSSGGSSAALAAGYGALSIGTDLAGSLRVPAFHCGIFAHKPTQGLVPFRGHVPPPLPALPSDRDMGSIGPMARSAADLSLLLDVVKGPDPLDAGKAFSLSLPPPRHADLKSYRVLVINSDPIMPTDAVVRAAIDRLAVNLAKARVSVTRETPLWPDFAAASRLFMRMLMSALSVGFPPDVYAGAVAAAADLPEQATSLQAERLRGIALSHRDWVMADGARMRLRAQWRMLFENFDAVICPVMPTPAFPHDHSQEQEKRRITIDGRDFPFPDQMAWQSVGNLTGLPATAIPIGLSGEGLPIGVQIVGPWLEDRTPLRLAELIEREFGGFVPPPDFDD